MNKNFSNSFSSVCRFRTFHLIVSVLKKNNNRSKITPWTHANVIPNFLPKGVSTKEGVSFSAQFVKNN